MPRADDFKYLGRGQAGDAPSTDSTEKPDDTAPPDGGYGWICVVACFMINCFTWGIVASYGVYLAYYLRFKTFQGAQPLDYAFIGGSTYASSMLVAPLVTYLAAEIGTRPTMSFGVIALAGGFFVASFATEIWHLYLSQGLLIGIGVGFVYIPSIAVLSQWFSKKRSLANGITSAGSGVGGVMFSLITGVSIEKISLAWALRITGIIAIVMTTIAIILTKDRNKVVKPSQDPFDTDLLRWPDVWLLLIWAFISMLGFVILFYSLSDFALSIGLSQGQATDVLMFMNLGTAVGRPSIGYLSDFFGRIKVTAVLTLLCGILCFAIWLPATTFGVTVLFAVISGAILGVFWVAIGPLCAEIAGLQKLPSLLSLSWLTVVLPTFFSEAIALKLKRWGSGRQYLYPQIFAGVAYLVASAFLFELQRRRTKHIRP